LTTITKGIMLNKLLLSCLFSFFFVSNIAANDAAYVAPYYAIEACTIFTGDKHGEFRNDYVAILNDGSGWKIHPEDRELFTQWDVQDIVHVGKRTSTYWFKREHKFELENHTRNQKVRVMLVQYPPNALYIVDSICYTTGYESVNHVDSNGTIYNTYVPIHVKKVFLNDGSAWIIENQNNFKYYNKGNKVYLGWNSGTNGFSLFLISGIEREATWTWVN